MEFRKIYIRRLIPVLGIILVLVLMIIGHQALKAQAQVADAREELRQIKNDEDKIDEEQLKNQLTDEVKEAVEAVLFEQLKTIKLSEYLSEEDYAAIYERIEEIILMESDAGTHETTLSSEQKGIINSLISDALSLYSEMNIRTEFNEEAKAEISMLIDEKIRREIDGLQDKIGGDMSAMKQDLSMTEEEKASLVKEISERVQHDLLEYITEHIQLIYDGEGEGEKQKELVCELEEHIHTEDCYTRELVCELEEDENHTHSDECYEYKVECDKAEHIHNDECYEIKDSEEESGTPGSSPCVHVHVDYLLTDDDRKTIVEDIIEGTDLAGVLSSIFYQEIEKSMSDIVKETMYEALLEYLSNRLEEIIGASLDGFEKRLLDVENMVSEFGKEIGEISGQVAALEIGNQNIRFNDVTGMIECFSGGEWKSFMSASSIWVSKGLIYSSGKKSENFEGLQGFAIATSNITYQETGSALKFSSWASYAPGIRAENTYITNPNRPFEFVSEYNTLRIDYGMVGTHSSVSHRKSNGETVEYAYHHTPYLTVQVIDYATKEVYSTQTVSGTKASLTQGVMNLALPNNPYYIKATYAYTLTGTSSGEAQGLGTSASAYIYSMQCVKK